MCLKYIVLCSLLLLLFSCKKEENIHIVALNPVTGEHYAGLTYYLVQQKTTSNGEENTTLKTGTLNSNGEAIFSIKLNRKHAYVIRVEEPENTCYNKSIQMYLDSPYDEDGKFTFEFAPCGNLKMNINNVNCEGSTDNMRFRFKYPYFEFEGWSTERIGCYNFISTDYVKVPSGWRIFECTVTRPSGTSLIKDSVFVPENGNVDFSLNY